jgi:hypothetical protein
LGDSISNAEPLEQSVVDSLLALNITWPTQSSGIGNRYTIADNKAIIPAIKRPLEPFDETVFLDGSRACESQRPQRG